MRGRLAVGAAALALAAAAGAQAPPRAAPDVPAGDAEIRGRIVHLARPEAVAGVEVVLYALPSAGAVRLDRWMRNPGAV